MRTHPDPLTHLTAVALERLLDGYVIGESNATQVSTEAVFVAREAVRAMALDGQLAAVRKAAAKSTRKPKRAPR